MSMKIQSILRIWCACLLSMMVAIAVCIHWIGYPVAGMFFQVSKHGESARSLFSGRIS
jgi:hypothetical protein